MKSELWGWSAVDLARAIATREISSREAVQASIERITQVNPMLNAVVRPPVLAEPTESEFYSLSVVTRAPAIWRRIDV